MIPPNLLEKDELQVPLPMSELSEAYVITSCGRIYSLASQKFIKCRKPGQATLTLQRKSYRCLVRKMVARAFLPNPYNATSVAYINDKDDRVSNLKWITSEAMTLREGELHAPIPIKGFEQMYSITSHGRVFSHVSGKFLLLNTDIHQNVRVPIVHRAPGKNPTIGYLVNQLVAKAFLPNPSGLPMVVHIDRNRQNNIVTNLKWATKECATDYHKHPGSKFTKFHGVTFCERLKVGSDDLKPWYVKNDRGSKINKRFYTEQAAALAYNEFIIANNLERPLNDLSDYNLDEIRAKEKAYSDKKPYRNNPARVEGMLKVLEEGELYAPLPVDDLEHAYSITSKGRIYSHVCMMFLKTKVDSVELMFNKVKYKYLLADLLKKAFQK